MPGGGDILMVVCEQLLPRQEGCVRISCTERSSRLQDKSDMG